MPHRWLILGSGGHGRLVADAIRAQGDAVLGFLVASKPQGLARHRQRQWLAVGLLPGLQLLADSGGAARFLPRRSGLRPGERR